MQKPSLNDALLAKELEKMSVEESVFHKAASGEFHSGSRAHLLNIFTLHVGATFGLGAHRFSYNGTSDGITIKIGGSSIVGDFKDAVVIKKDIQKLLKRVFNNKKLNMYLLNIDHKLEVGFEPV